MILARVRLVNKRLLHTHKGIYPHQIADTKSPLNQTPRVKISSTIMNNSHNPTEPPVVKFTPFTNKLIANTHQPKLPKSIPRIARAVNDSNTTFKYLSSTPWETDASSSKEESNKTIEHPKSSNSIIGENDFELIDLCSSSEISSVSSMFDDEEDRMNVDENIVIQQDTEEFVNNKLTEKPDAFWRSNSSEVIL